MLDPGPNLPKSDHVTLSDHPHIGRGRSIVNSYGNYPGTISDSRVQKTSQNYANYRLFNNNNNNNCSDMEDDSEVSTPPLWRTSPSRSPPLHTQNVGYRCLSPTSKTQAIARGQRELMEMVSRMPESCYELSLKDLVEHQHGVVNVEPKQESVVEEMSTVHEDRCKNKKKQNRQKPQIKRSGSIDNGGFLLKMVFPISLRSTKSNKKKKKKNDSNTNSKVSPRPSVSDASAGKSVDKDWWKKRSGSTESESGGSTVNGGSTKSSRSSSTGSSSSNSCRSMSINNSSQRQESNGCLAFIRGRKSTGSR